MQAILNKWRVTILLFVFFVIAGLLAIGEIPKEETPDVSLPNIYVSIGLNGISAQDADKLLIQPMQKHLSGLSGLKKLKSVASLSHASFNIEFDSDTDIDTALAQVQRAVNKGEKDLPIEADKPTVSEINLSLLPIITVAVSGDMDETVLLRTTKRLQNAIEALTLVLEAEIKGSRKEIVEVIIDPEKMNALNLDLDKIFNLVVNNNVLIAAGSIDNSSGRFNLKVPGLIENIDQFYNFPIVHHPLKTITLKDIATIKLGFDQASSVAYMNGKRTILLEVKKRLGANLIQTVADIKNQVDNIADALPNGIEISYSLDASKNIISSLRDLMNNIVFATILVMLVVLLFIGIRNSFLVGLAIPGAFLTAIFIINLSGYTLNIVVLFALILSVGLLVDSAIVITEASSRYLDLGKSRFDAYLLAVKELGLPIISSTVTTLVVFLPLLFWPGIIGDFMFYLPFTLIVVLSGALLISLLVIPSFGLILPVSKTKKEQQSTNTAAINNNKFENLIGFSAIYYAIVKKVVNWPILTLLSTVSLFVVIFYAYANFNYGTIFFPKIEPQDGYMAINARSNLSLKQREMIALKANNILLAMPELNNIYMVAGSIDREKKDQIAQINYEFANWWQRRKASQINQDIAKKMVSIPGVIIEVLERKAGPPGGASDINLLVASDNKEDAFNSAQKIYQYMQNKTSLKDLRNDYFQSDREWQLVIDRKKAAEFGLSIAKAAKYARMATNGLTVSEFHSDFSDDSLDIRLLYPDGYRNIDQIKKIKIIKDGQLIPLANFSSIQSAKETGEIRRTNGAYSYRIYANTKESFNTNQIINEINQAIEQFNLAKNVFISFEGEAEQQAETSAFLVKAFASSIFIMFLVLMLQFNSFYHSLLVLSAVVFSTGGVLIGFLLNQEAFVIVMGGIGIIALAGVVVNNNIILISAYENFLAEKLSPIEAVIKACLTRLRPVLLTAFTTVLGLMPMVYQININLIDQSINFDAPSTQWWVALSTTIVGGLSIATLITLLFIPAMLVLPQKFKRKNKSTANLNNEFIQTE